MIRLRSSSIPPRDRVLARFPWLLPLTRVPRRWWTAALAVAAGAGVLSSCSSIERTVIAPPLIEGATFVGNKACFECHTNIVRSFRSSPHARLHSAELQMKGESGCESCHGPGSRHIAAGGGRGRFILNPVHDSQPCLNCHLQTHAELQLPQHHPVLEGKMNCVQCHDPHGSEILKPAGAGLAMARLNETCASCHFEQARPRVFQHDAMREGCTVCHTPHGSINAKLLVERDANLCLKCHAQLGGAAGTLFIGTIDHAPFLSRGACWSAGCHSAIHGSSVSPNLHY